MRLYKKCGYILMLLSALFLGGCAGLVWMGNGAEQEQYLEKAVQSLRGGNEKQGRELLERVIAAPPTAGVTDEALFRLALLHLNNEAGKGAVRTLALLERLKKEYPTSSWTHQSAPLLAYLHGARVYHDREREQNILMQRENRELRQSIERLKNLDMEMDKKIRR